MSGNCGYAKPPRKQYSTVYNGLWLTAALEEKRGIYGDDAAVDIR